MTTTIVETNHLPVTVDLPPVRTGSDYPFTILIEDDNGDAIDTSTWGTMEIKGKAYSANGPEVFDLTEGVEITVTAASGQYDVVIPAATTTAIKVSKVYWDCKIEDENGLVHTPFDGVFTVLQGISA